MEVETTVRSEIVARLGAAGVPGCAIATTTASGRTTSLYHGHASLVPARPVTRRCAFHLFSGTKVYTAAAVMRLVERGEIDLDRPITDYLPELVFRHPVTVRALACHDSGLPETLRALLSVHPADSRGPSTAEALARFRLDRGRPPGSGARYRNVNYALLGELVARVSGMSYEGFVRDEILAPLGADVAFGVPPELQAHAAVGYMPRWSPMRLALWFLMPGWVVGSAHQNLVSLQPFALDTAAIGGLVGTAEGFLPMLGEMLRLDDGVLAVASKQQMLQLHARGAAGIVSRVGVGLGWKRGQVDGVDFWNHEGGGPGFCSETRLYPEADLGIVVLMNRSQSAGLSKVCHAICEALRAATKA